MIVRTAGVSDRTELVRMRMALWPDSTAAEVDERLKFRPEQGVTFVAERVEGELVGFAEINLRRFAEGCTSSPVPYLEGIWVDGNRRRRGLATALLGEAEVWCRAHGFNELASDCEISNEGSAQFHRAAGFEEVQRNISFRRALDRDAS